MCAWGMSSKAGLVIATLAACAMPAAAAVNLELRPSTQTQPVGATVALGLYVVSDSAEAQPVGFVRAVLSWDASLLSLSGVNDNGPVEWASSGFPDDSDVDGLNDTFLDGTALYEAFGFFGGAEATPEGLLVTTLEFVGLTTTPGTTVAIVEQIGDTNSVVLNAPPPFGADVTGTLGWATVVLICSADGDCDDSNPCTDDACIGQACQSEANDANDPDDGFYCNGIEDHCEGGEIVYATPPPDCDDGVSCTDDSCDESADVCVNALREATCLIEGACFDEDELNPDGDCTSCKPSSNPNAWSDRPLGAACGDPGDSLCDHPDACDGAGECLSHEEPDGTACTSDANSCTDDVCAAATCSHPLSPEGSSCGSAVVNQCTDADTCDDVGTCQPNHVADTTPCDDDLFCTATSSCLGGLCAGEGALCPDLICDEVADVCKAVRLELRPNDQDVLIGETVEVDLFAVSLTGQDVSVNSVAAIFLWNPSRISLIGQSDQGPYEWLTSGFPDDCGLDGVNAPCPGFPQDDGNVYYVAIGSFSTPAVVTPAGLWVTTLEFQTNVPGVTTLELSAAFGQFTESTVIDAETAGLDILAELGPSATLQVLECAVDPDCGDGIFCNGDELCTAGTCTTGEDPCPGQVCDGSIDACVDCLTDVNCDDGSFCNGAEICAGALCQPGDDPCPDLLCNESLMACAECLGDGDCDDGIPCTVDSCSGTACVNAPDPLSCDDDVFCNGEARCVAGTGCVDGVNPCPDPETCEESSATCGGCPTPSLQGVGGRYLAVTPPAGLDPVALRLTGAPDDEGVSCVARYIQLDGSLADAAVFLLPAEWLTVSVHGSAILPNTTYRAHTDCGSAADPLLSAAAEATTWGWGDVNQSGGADLDDILAVLDGFQGGGAAIEQVDLSGPGCAPDGGVDLDDILAVLGAFAGQDHGCPVPCGAPCVEDQDCEDGDTCTVDACDPSDPASEFDGCVHQYVQRSFGDVDHPFAGETTATQPDLDDILCVLAAFSAGEAWAIACPLAQLVSSVNPDVCDTSLDTVPAINLGDILAVLGAFEGNSVCPAPCP